MTKNKVSKNVKKRYLKQRWTNFQGSSEKDFEPSQTIPDLSLTIPQMLIRYQNGMELPIDDRLKWQDPEEYIPRITDLTDITELEAELASYKDAIADRDADLIKQQKAQQKQDEADLELFRKHKENILKEQKVKEQEQKQ